VVLVSDDDDDDEKEEEKAYARRSPPDPTCERSVWSVGAGAVVEAPPYGLLLGMVSVWPFVDAPGGTFPFGAHCSVSVVSAESKPFRVYSQPVECAPPYFHECQYFAGIILIFFCYHCFLFKCSN